MPFGLRKVPKKDLYWVVNKESGKKHSKEGLPKDRAEAQMRALYAAESGYVLGKQSKGKRKAKGGFLLPRMNMTIAERDAAVRGKKKGGAEPPVVPETIPEEVGLEGLQPEQVEQFVPSPPQPPFPISVPNPEPVVTEDDVLTAKYSGSGLYPSANPAVVSIRKPTGYKAPAVRERAAKRASEEALMKEYVRRRLNISEVGDIV